MTSVLLKNAVLNLMNIFFRLDKNVNGSLLLAEAFLFGVSIRFVWQLQWIYVVVFFEEQRSLTNTSNTT